MYIVENAHRTVRTRKEVYLKKFTVHEYESKIYLSKGQVARLWKLKTDIGKTVAYVCSM